MMTTVLIPPIQDLTHLTTPQVDEIQNKFRIPDSILVVIGNPVGIIVAGLRQPKAVVLVCDPLFPGLAQRFQELMMTATSYPEASILSTELIANTEMDPHESGAFERLLDNTWCSQYSFAQLKECKIHLCQSFEEATQFYPNHHMEVYSQNEGDAIRAVSPPVSLALAQSAFLFGFGSDS